MTTQMTQLQNENWKPKLLIVGTALGALLGFISAYFMARSAEERAGGPPEISTGDLLRVSIGVIGLMRGIAALGDGR